MRGKYMFSPNELHYLKLLAKQYPTLQAASNEAIRLEAILNLPKATEYFMSDIHGEHEAFLHILNSSSGEVREKLKECFGDSISREERRNLSTLAGYTLIFNSRHFGIVSHQPFAGRKEALNRNRDIDNDSLIFETLEKRMKVSQTDEGVGLRVQVEDLMRLMDAYRSGAVAEDHKD